MEIRDVCIHVTTLCYLTSYLMCFFNILWLHTPICICQGFRAAGHAISSSASSFWIPMSFKSLWFTSVYLNFGLLLGRVLMIYASDGDFIGQTPSIKKVRKSFFRHFFWPTWATTWFNHYESWHRSKTYLCKSTGQILSWFLLIFPGDPNQFTTPLFMGPWFDPFPNNYGRNR